MSLDKVNIKHSSFSEYDNEWIRDTWGWDTPEEFIRSKGLNLRPRIQTCLKIADLHPSMNILDVGCGRGEIVLHCARQGIYAVGVDFSKEVLSIAQAALEKHTPEQQRLMKFICDDVKNLDSEGPFDRIFMLDLVEHLYDWELNELFQHCKALLKPEGQIIIHTLPNRWLYDITYRRLLRLVMPWLPSDPRSEREKTIHVNEMSIINLYKILKSNELDCRIWLQDMIINQAKWHIHEALPDKRENLYKWMRKPLIGAIFRLLSLTPLRLLIVNDIFAVAVPKGQSILLHKSIRRHWIEQLTCQLSTKRG